MAAFYAPSRTGNVLLDRLPQEEYARLLPSWETVHSPNGYEICSQNGPMSHAVVETASVGNEGMIGIPVVLDLRFSPITAISQVAGKGLRIEARVFLKAMKAGGALDKVLRRFIAFSLRYAYQTVVCNAQHSVEERMCRWLLMTQDRVGEQ